MNLLIAEGSSKGNNDEKLTKNKPKKKIKEWDTKKSKIIDPKEKGKPHRRQAN